MIAKIEKQTDRLRFAGRLTVAERCLFGPLAKGEDFASFPQYKREKSCQKSNLAKPLQS
jgi:hypothetical protein